jgi:hypothetical protein
MPARRFPPPWAVEEFDLDQTTVFAISFYLVHERVRFRNSFRTNPPLLRATVSGGRNGLDSLARPQND